jgi:hypothetical protein
LFFDQAAIRLHSFNSTLDHRPEIAAVPLAGSRYLRNGIHQVFHECALVLGASDVGAVRVRVAVDYLAAIDRIEDSALDILIERGRCTVQQRELYSSHSLHPVAGDVGRQLRVGQLNA